jgi:hypothetical protein
MGMIITNGNDHNKSASKSLTGYKAVNDRIMYMRVKARPVNVTCLQVCAPTTSMETMDIEEFYRNLQSVLNKIPRKDVLILMGNWNSKIGKGEETEMAEKYGLGNRNEAGERLLEFCTENALFLANTYFEQPEQRLYTWTSPDGKYKNQMECILGRI